MGTFSDVKSVLTKIAGTSMAIMDRKKWEKIVPAISNFEVWPWPKKIIAFLDYYKIQMREEILTTLNQMTAEHFYYEGAKTHPAKMLLQAKEVAEKRNQPRFSPRQSLVNELFYNLLIKPWLIYVCWLRLFEINKQCQTGYQDLVEYLIGRSGFDEVFRRRILRHLQVMVFDKYDESPQLDKMFEAMPAAHLQSVIDKHLKLSEEVAYFEIYFTNCVHEVFGPAMEGFRVISLEEIAKLENMLTTLSQREMMVLRFYFGLNEQKLTLEEIGEKFNLGRERVRMIKEKAVRRLRRGSRMDRLDTIKADMSEE